MRLFIAINFSDAMRGALIALREDLRGKSTKGRFSLDENLHLTLAFLGECTLTQKETAIRAMEDVRFSPFAIEVNRIGRFRRDGCDIWWAGLRENQLLLQLQQELTEKLRRCGFLLELRKYTPHITLGRQIVTDEHPRSIALIKENVTQIDLMESTRIDGKLTYRSIWKKMQVLNFYGLGNLLI